MLERLKNEKKKSTQIIFYLKLYIIETGGWDKDMS